MTTIKTKIHFGQRKSKYKVKYNIKIKDLTQKLACYCVVWSLW